MKILIADDNSEKQSNLKSTILDNFNDIQIVQSWAMNTTFSEIKTCSYDLILLDMTMPSYASNSKSSHELRTLAGRDLILKLAYRKISVPIIIVTAFEVFGRHESIEHINSISGDLINEYPELVKGYIIYDFQSDSWKSSLIKEIKKYSHD